MTFLTWQEYTDAVSDHNDYDDIDDDGNDDDDEDDDDFFLTWQECTTVWRRLRDRRRCNAALPELHNHHLMIMIFGFFGIIHCQSCVIIV